MKLDLRFLHYTIMLKTFFIYSHLTFSKPIYAVKFLVGAIKILLKSHFCHFLLIKFIVSEFHLEMTRLVIFYNIQNINSVYKLHIFYFDCAQFHL